MTNDPHPPSPPPAPASRGWGETLRRSADIRVLRMAFLGFSAGLPLLLIFSTLSVWLREAGIDRGTVTMLSWAALAYSFKFVWAPLVDRLPLPVLTRRLGRRRGWLLLAQCGLIAGMLLTGAFDPAQALTWTAAGAILIGFSSATQDIVIDAYRIEAAEPDLQSMLSASYIAGYRIGMLVAGAGSLWLAQLLEPTGVYDPAAWSWVYRAMAGFMGVGILTTLLIPEPALYRPAAGDGPTSLRDQSRFVLLVLLCAAAFLSVFVLGESLSADLARGLEASTGMAPHLAGFLGETVRFAAAVLAALAAGGALMAAGLASKAHARATYLAPVADFMSRYGKTALLVLALVGTYRIADIIMGAISNVFYVDMGFTKGQIATYTKFWGLWATILGGFLGGLVAVRIGVMRALMLGAVLAAASNLLFALLAVRGDDAFMLLVVIVADNLSAGMASAAFVAYLSALTSVSFTAMQYALFSSLMTLMPKILAGYAGTVVDAVGYPAFFVGTAIVGVPVILLVLTTARLAPPDQHRG